MTNREALNVIADMCNALQLLPNSRQGEAMKMAINSLKNGTLPVENKGEWIPVFKRSPEKSGNYWCTFGGTYLTGIDYYVTESNAKELFEDWEECVGWQSQNVIAWMPLPEPYKAESENKNDKDN
jgi:hypothetical protein